MAFLRAQILTLALILLSSFSPTLSFLPKANLGWIKGKRNVLSHPPQSLVVLQSTPTRRKPSRVTDEDGSTPDPTEVEMEEVDDIPELREITDASEMPPGPIPHQPWRRGETNGCEDPITAEWRVKAENIMTTAAELVGGKVLDITWFLTSVVVCIDDDVSAASDVLGTNGPHIEVRSRASKPIYYDPEDPNPEEIWGDEEEIVYQRETEEEAQERKDKKRNMYANLDENDDPNESHIPEGEDDEEVTFYMNEETRADVAYTEALEAKQRYDEEEKAGAPNADRLFDRNALSTIAGAILEALEEAEPELRILSRHELVLAAPGEPEYLQDQKQFDSHRGEPVIVQTQDPWNSNRVLKGTLLDRNSMDLLINKKGRMVTIPLNFVEYVKVDFGYEEVEE